MQRELLKSDPFKGEKNPTTGFSFGLLPLAIYLLGGRWFRHAWEKTPN